MLSKCCGKRPESNWEPLSNWELLRREQDRADETDSIGHLDQSVETGTQLVVSSDFARGIEISRRRIDNVIKVLLEIQ